MLQCKFSTKKCGQQIRNSLIDAQTISQELELHIKSNFSDAEKKSGLQFNDESQHIALRISIFSGQDFGTLSFIEISTFRKIKETFKKN